MKVAVIGGMGFIGSKLSESLVASGNDVTVFDLCWFGVKSLKSPLVQKDFRALDVEDLVGFDAVVHLANVANDPAVDLDPVISWEINSLGSMNLAELCVEAGVKKLVFFSSGSVYGVSEEDKVTEETKLKPISAYNKTKMIAERVFLSYAHKIDLHILRPATVCGTSLRTRFDVVVNLLVQQAISNGQVKVLGGDQYRPHVHIDDIVDVTMACLQGRIPPDIFNVGFEVLTVKELAVKICEKVGCEMLVLPSNDPRSYRLSSDKLLGTGFKPRKGVDDAISDLVGGLIDGSLVVDESAYSIAFLKSQSIS